jgi:hypothetical protein
MGNSRVFLLNFSVILRMIFLCMGLYLCKCSSSDNGGNLMPVITIHILSFQKLFMFRLCPFALIVHNEDFCIRR